MFEEATKLKLRFETGKGLASTEDLWDLPLTSRGVSLNEIAKGINRKLKDLEEEDFVVGCSRESTELKLKLDIVKYIIKSKLESAEKAKAATQNKAKRDKILNILAEKEDESLKNMNEDDLKKLLEGL